MSAFTTTDVVSLRTNLGVAVCLLGAIFSWLTPYPWWADALIAVAVSLTHTAIVMIGTIGDVLRGRR